MAPNTTTNDNGKTEDEAGNQTAEQKTDLEVQKQFHDLEHLLSIDGAKFYLRKGVNVESIAIFDRHGNHKATVKTDNIRVALQKAEGVLDEPW